MQDGDEVELIAAARSGRSDAMRELLSRYHRRLHAFLFRLVWNREDALDLLQDALFDIVLGLPTLQHAERFQSWCFRIAYHKAMDWRKRRREAQLDEQAATLSSPAGNPEAVSLQFERNESLVQALGKLSTEHRAVIALHYMEEMSYEAMALTLDIPVGTVTSRLHHAKASLRRLLED